MSYNKLIAIVVILIVVLQIAIADNGGEKKEISEEELKELGTGVSGEKVGDTYYIKSGAVTGDLSGKKVVVSSDGSVVIGEEMKGTIAVQGGTITLPPPSNRKARGTGTCDNSGCTFLSGESGEGNEKVSDGSFRVKNDGTVDVLTSATIGEGDKSFEITNVQNLRFNGGKITGVTVDDSEIAGNIVGNKANFEYDAETKELGLTKPEGVAEDYKIKVDKFATATTITGENILFEDPLTPVKELVKGKVNKMNNNDLFYESGSKFENEHNTIFTITKHTWYISGFILPDYVDDNYIKSDVDKKAGVMVLSIHSRRNDIEIDLGQGNPYIMFDLDNTGSEIIITEKDITVKSNKKGELSANTIKNLKKIYRSKKRATYDYVSSEGIGKCSWDGCEKIILSIAAKREGAIQEAFIISKKKSRDIKEKDIEELITALKDSDSEVREKAAFLLGIIENQEITEALLTALKDEDSNVRRQAILSLAGREGEGVTEALLTTLKDEDTNVKVAAVSVLGEIKDSRVTEELIKVYGDFSVRIPLLSSLGTREDPALFLAFAEYMAKERRFEFDPAKLPELKEKIQLLEGTYTSDLKDFYLLSKLSVADVKFDRKSLEESLSNKIGKLEHTHIQFKVAYKEDFDDQEHRLTSMELKKIDLILESMNSKEIKDNIGKLIEADLKEDETELFGVKDNGMEGNFKIVGSKTEVGGLVYLDENKKLDFVPYESTEINNKEHSSVIELSDIPLIFSNFHLHAVEDDSSKGAGPSEEGDLTSAEILNIDGMVITPIGEGKFNIDYYTPDGKVIDIGNFEYK